MHEYSVASELINALLPQAESLGGKVVAVFLKKGELRILSNHAMVNAFKLLAEGTVLEDAHLEIELIPVTVACSSCGYKGCANHVEDEAFHFSVPILSCPTCGAEVDLLTGRELVVDRLSVQTSEDTESS